MGRMVRLANLTVAAVVTTTLCTSRPAQSQSPPPCTTDADGDGHRSIACGGDDCDDNDPNRYPGNAEVCDADGHDEDCEVSTYGHRDNDLDGQDDARCCNYGQCSPGVALNGWCCGSDWDDSNPAIHSGSQACDGERVIRFDAGGGVPSDCLAGTKCIPQPNGSGVCGVPPPGYKAPPPFALPPQPQQRAPLPSFKTLVALKRAPAVVAPPRVRLPSVK